MQYIVLIGAFQALVSIWLLSVKEKKGISNYFFKFLLSAIAVHLIIKFFIFTFIPDQSIRQQMNTFISVCYGPLIYLYTLSKTKSNFSLVKKWFMFIPLFVLMTSYFTVSGVFIILNRVNHHLLDLYNNFSLSLIFVVNLYYPMKSIFIVKKSVNSNLEKNESDIIVRISSCLLIMELILIISKCISLISPDLNQSLNIPFRIATYIILLGICLLIIKKSLQSENTLKTILHEEAEFKQKGIVTEIFFDSNEYKIKFENIWMRLDECVKKQELFRNCDLNLDILSSKSEINKYQISEMLNSYKNKPFYRYINEYRIEYFISSVDKAAANNENINFLSLAYDAGFKSKSSFNRYFKEIKGQTPSMYYKNMMTRINSELQLD